MRIVKGPRRPCTWAAKFTPPPGRSKRAGVDADVGAAVVGQRADRLDGADFLEVDGLRARRSASGF